jgi:hypothetical protein
MSVGSVVVGALLVAVVIGLFVMKFQAIRIIWSAWWDLFKRRDK